MHDCTCGVPLNHMQTYPALGCVHIDMSTSLALSGYPVYEFRHTRVCMYFNGGHSHYEHGLPVNFTRTSSSCAGHVFIQPVRSKLPINNNNVMYKSYGTYLTSELSL